MTPLPRAFLTTVLGVLAASAVGCEDRSTTKAPLQSPGKGGHSERADHELGKLPERVVQRLHREMTDEEAARIARVGLAARTHDHSEEEPSSSATIQLVGWQLGGTYESGRVAIELTYVVVHPKGGQAFWHPADHLSLGLDALESWAMSSVCAVREDGTLDAILHRNSGTADSITWAPPRSHVFDVDDFRVEVVKTPHVVERTPLKLLAKADIPLWSPLRLRRVDSAEPQNPLVVLIGVTQSAVESDAPRRAESSHETTRGGR
jgi:hypothetical protein